ncbi:MAG: serine/threonine-protein kinase [Ferruginibacter sp.]
MLHLNEGDIFASNYRLKRMVDTGGFADVWEAVFLTAGNTVALKIYPKLDTDGIKNIELEYTNQSELSHSNLVNARYLGYHEGYPFLEMRYYPGGNASSRLGEADEKEIARCVCNIGSALEYLHADNRVHQDIKPNNFLIDRNGNFYLADLGLSLQLRTTIQRFTRTKATKNINDYIAGTTPPCYRAPELCDRSSIGADPIKATDIWAFGASLYELATGEMPFGEFGGCTQLHSPECPDLPSKFSKELNFIIKKSLSKNAWDRPKAAELAKMAEHYLETGKWYIERETNIIDKPNPGHNNGNGSTVKQGAFPGNDFQQEEPKPTSKKGLLIILASIIAFSLIAGGLYYTRTKADSVVTTGSSGDSKDSVGVANADTSRSTFAKDTTFRVKETQKVVTPPVTERIDSTVKKPTPITTDEPIKPIKEEEVTIRSPQVSTMPLGDCPPEIRTIIRGKSDFRVIFYMKTCLNNLSLYTPGDDRAFYVRSSRDKSIRFKLRSISSSGESINVPSSGLYVTAVFERVNENITDVDIMEGQNPLDNTGTTYFNFKGVSITKK